MLTNGERTVLYGGMALIAYLLYEQKRCACGQGSGVFAGGGQGCAAPASATGSGIASPWIQQLSGHVSGWDYFTPQCGMFGRCG